MPVDVVVLGADAAAKTIEAQIRGFYRAQRVRAGQAGQLLRVSVQRAIDTTFRRDSTRFRDREGRRTKLPAGQKVVRPGAMRRNVVRVIKDAPGRLSGNEIEVYVQYGRRAYFGIHETGGTIHAGRGAGKAGQKRYLLI